MTCNRTDPHPFGECGNHLREAQVAVIRAGEQVEQTLDRFGPGSSENDEAVAAFVAAEEALRATRDATFA